MDLIPKVVLKLFREEETDFSSLGDFIIKDVKAAKITENLNGEFYLTLELSAKYRYLLSQCAVVAALYHGSWEGFRVQNINKDHGRYITYKLPHLSCDMKDYLIESLTVTSTDLNGLLNAVKSSTTRSNKFNFTNNCNLTNLAIEIDNQDLQTVIYKIAEDNSLKVVRHNYNISLEQNTHYADDTLEDGYNITKLNEVSTTDNLVTELYPRLHFTVHDNIEYHSLDQKCIRSNACGFKRVYTKKVDFEPRNQDYLQSFVDRLNQLQEIIDNAKSQINSDTEELHTKINEKAEKEDELLHLNNDLANNYNIMQTATAVIMTEEPALKAVCSTIIANLQAEANKQLAKAQTAQQNQTKRQNEKSKLKFQVDNLKEQYKQQVKKKLKNKAKETQKKIANLNKKLDKLSNQISNHNSDYSEAMSLVSELNTETAKFTDITKVTYDDIKDAVNMLKTYSHTIYIDKIIKQYATDYSDGKTAEQLEEAQDNIKQDLEDVQKAQEELKNIKDEIARLQFDKGSQTQLLNNSNSEMADVEKNLDKEIQEDLYEQATEYIEKYQYPQVSYTVESLPLHNVNVGDTVLLRHKGYGITLDIIVSCIEFNVLTQRDISVKLGDYDTSISGTVDNIVSSNTEGIVRQQAQLQQQANAADMLADIHNRYADVTEALNALEKEYRDRINTLNIIQTLYAAKVETKITEQQGNRIAESVATQKASEVTTEVKEYTDTKFANATDGNYKIQVEMTDDGYITDKTKDIELTATVFKIAEDITSTLEDWQFIWTRSSNNKKKDALFNAKGLQGRQITLKPEDLDSDIILNFTCTVFLDIEESMLLCEDGNTLLCEDGSYLLAQKPKHKVSVSKTININADALFSQIKQTAREISLIVASADSKGQITLTDNMLTAIATQIVLKANQIQLEGYVSANGKFLISTDGAVISQNDDGDIVELKDGTIELVNTSGDHTNLTSVLTPFLLSLGYGTTCYAELSCGIDGGTGKLDLPDGNIYTGQINLNSSPIVTSDRTEKHDIEDMDSRYIELFDKLTFRRFKYNKGTSDRYHVGIIAQELEQAMIECGIDTKEFAGLVSEESADGTKYYVRNELIHYLADNKVKEQDKVIKEQEQRISKLEELVNKLLEERESE